MRTLPLFEVTATCPNSHTQTVTIAGLSRESVETWAELIDGTSTFYLDHHDAATVIGRCGHPGCGQPFTCAVREKTAEGGES